VRWAFAAAEVTRIAMEARFLAGSDSDDRRCHRDFARAMKGMEVEVALALGQVSRRHLVDHVVVGPAVHSHPEAGLQVQLPYSYPESWPSLDRRNLSTQVVDHWCISDKSSPHSQ
jgi:hypothetical protein